jgi:hypothetical protein
MALRHHLGSCHCGRVRYSADIDLAATTTKCNCTYCAKTRAWTTPVRPTAFALLSGGDSIAAYRKHALAPNKHFCRHCGVVTHADGEADYMGGAYVIVFVATLDDATQEDLAGVPVRYCNGRDDLWQEPPKITAHL